MMEPQKSIENILIKNRLLKQLETKEITKEEFLKECAYWVLQSLDEYSPENEPQQPPRMDWYYSLSPDKKEKVSSDFWREGEVFNYLEERQRISNRNRANLYWLGEWLQYIPKEDTATRGKLISKIRELKGYNLTQEEW